MSHLGPLAIMLIVLSPVLIPLLITAFHAAAGAQHSNAQIGEAALRSRPRDR
jgi:hypothetical protein